MLLFVSRGGRGTRRRNATEYPDAMIEFVYWTACMTLVYVYVLFPLIIRLLSRQFGTAVAESDLLLRVTLIVTAYNEEKGILAKLANLLAVDYPSELVDIIVASDASTDTTDQLVRDCVSDRVQLLRVDGRKGKTNCQNAAATIARGEILVFTDATTRLDAQALRALVRRFCSSNVGCVAGRLMYVSQTENVTGRGGEAYWDYEIKLRMAESAMGSLVGVSGCLYAVRRSAYRPINPGLISDFVISMKMREQSLRAVLAVDAICYEDTLNGGAQELSMRVRVAIRSINALISERRFLNPWRYGLFAWQLWSHKLLRYASPFLWLIALGTNIALMSRTPLYTALFLGQIAVIVTGTMGFALQSRLENLGFLNRPYYFLLTNVASFLAAIRYARGERMVTWKPLR
jgi:cellulose synthase/poly-beta-1,6-N-acetylglucosamine synthase-like glycosyltransferase